MAPRYQWLSVVSVAVFMLLRETRSLSSNQMTEERRLDERKSLMAPVPPVRRHFAVWLRLLPIRSVSILLGYLQHLSPLAPLSLSWTPPAIIALSYLDLLEIAIIPLHPCLVISGYAQFNAMGSFILQRYRQLANAGMPGGYMPGWSEKKYRGPGLARRAIRGRMLC